MLRVERVYKRFGGVTAVRNCSLDVEAGSITGLIGPNGAGKTTLFNIIAGRYKPDSGRVFFKDEAIDGLLPHQIFQRRLYRTFQITREFSQMTVLENLMIMPAGQLGETIWNIWLRPGAVRSQENEIKQRALAVLDFVELTDLKDTYAGSLSGGQKKLLEIARSLMAEPEMVLLDEPGAGVNPTLMKKLVDNIRRLRDERGITFLLIEHNMDLIMELCNPIIVMSEGTKLAQGPPEAIRGNEKVLEAYLGGQYR